jgi:hypothetical protein
MLSRNNLLIRILRRLQDELFPPSHPFDQANGVDTSGRLSLRRLEVVSPNRKYGRNYQGVEPGRFADALADIPVDCSGFTFVDLGAGKGRAMLLAGGLNFRRIIGVEFSPKLARIAQSNLTKLKLKAAELIVGDASEFCFPNEPLVVFVFNAFGPEILKRILCNLNSHPGPLYLAYLNPIHDETIRDHGSLNPLITGKFHSIWYRDELRRRSDIVAVAS